ncbi:MAG: tetratricopeptide repeat protein, partial [Kiloniellales bacterium]|nr:tetratricopeptide repeat protein [Kiloniellales bacterium]
NRAGVDLIRRAIEIRGGRAVYHFNLGVALAAAGDAAGAEEAYRRCLALAPDRIEAHNNLGLLLQDRGDLEDAVAAFRAALALDPQSAEAHANLGRALQELGRDEAALAGFERALALDPRLPEAHFGRGRSLEQQGRWAEAEAAYRAALDARPRFQEAENNLAATLLAQGRYDAAQEAFDRLRERLRGPAVETAEALLSDRPLGSGPAVATRFSLLDRAQQLEDLLRRQAIDPDFAAVVERLRCVWAELGPEDGAEDGPEDGPDWRRALTDDQAARLGGALARIVHYADAPRIPGPAINPDLDYAAIERAYLNADPPAVHFDDFLTPEALAGLRQFCRDSTIYFGSDPAGFVSATMAGGFNCSLMYQIAEELKAALPSVLGPHHLSNMWSYRHRAEGGGVLAHTDLAAVTFNFWITPDEANLDPESGGLVVYAKEEPLDWDWMRINRRKSRPEVRTHIEAFREGAREIVIPHRSNRAVMFHSNLFHRSDRFAFADAFESRRINISLLFGRRQRDLVSGAPT